VVFETLFLACLVMAAIAWTGLAPSGTGLK